MSSNSHSLSRPGARLSLSLLWAWLQPAPGWVPGHLLCGMRVLPAGWRPCGSHRPGWSQPRTREETPGKLGASLRSRCRHAPLRQAWAGIWGCCRDLGLAAWACKARSSNPCRRRGRPPTPICWAGGSGPPASRRRDPGDVCRETRNSPQGEEPNSSDPGTF